MMKRGIGMEPKKQKYNIITEENTFNVDLVYRICAAVIKNASGKCFSKNAPETKTRTEFAEKPYTL